MSKNIIIRRCSCSNQAQDNMHGSQMRVHNITSKTKDKDVPLWRCTVCRKEIPSKVE